MAAFDIQAVDYLVKPVELGRFQQAVARVAAAQQLAAAPAALAPAAAPATSSLFVKVGTRTVRVNFNDVLYIEALSTYSVLVTPTHKHIIYLTLKALSERLPFAHFVRVHRSYIVNTHRIESIEDGMLKLAQYEIPVGKSYQEEFMRKLESL